MRNNDTSEQQRVPEHYVPSSLSSKDFKKQKQELKKSRKLYKKGKYYTRKKVKSYTSKRSPHIKRVEEIYDIDTNSPDILKHLSKKTKCSKQSLEKIISKGMGAYYSSGSRPNQTPHSWGYARLYSAITGGPASAIDHHILEKGCEKNSLALRLSKKPRKNTPRKKIVLGGFRMKEKIISFDKSPIHGKKYRATIKNIDSGKLRTIDFGASDYEQYKDRTPLQLYANKNHGSRKRMRNYFNRHSGTPIRENAIEKEKQKSNGYYNAKILSHEYLW
jgi:hypothetical protein